MITVKNRRTYDGPGEYIGRPSPLGNPFPMKEEAQRFEVIAWYKGWLWDQVRKENVEVTKELDRLTDIAAYGDLILICWCAPKPCHGDVVKAYIEWRLKQE
jgi:hypothetical protein